MVARRMAGAHAAPDAGQARGACCRRRASCGSTAATIADGGRAIAAALGDLEERVSRPLVLIVGMMATKDGEGFLRNFAGLARRVIAVPISSGQGAARGRLGGYRAQNVGIPALRAATMSKVRLRRPRGSNLPRRRAS